MLLSGSAPLSKDTIEFLKICFSCSFQEGYGLTETLATSVTLPEDKIAGTVGGTTLNVELKLVDVPDMNYYSTDQKEGVTYP